MPLFENFQRTTEERNENEKQNQCCLRDCCPVIECDRHASGNHHANWLECIKTRKLPICDVEIGHRSATVCHLGNIAVRLGRSIKWDPVKEEFIGDTDAPNMLSRPYRAPWKLPEV